MLGRPTEGDLHRGCHPQEVVLQAVRRYLSCGPFVDLFSKPISSILFVTGILLHNITRTSRIGCLSDSSSIREENVNTVDKSGYNSDEIISPVKEGDRYHHELHFTFLKLFFCKRKNINPSGCEQFNET